MAPTITNLFILSILSNIMKSTILLIQGQKQVPCLFFMGDSQIDNGNNNFLITSAKANYPPYGIDYPDGPTGRFSNGQNIPDFIAEFLGFGKPIPPFATVNGSSEILIGANYGSGAAGILKDSGRLQGERIDMDQQLSNHGITSSKIAFLLKNATLARDHLNKCLYVISMGSNDYLNNYLIPQFYPISSSYTPDEFAEILITRYSRQLKILYEYGARKIAIFGLGILGCVPQELSMNPRNGSPCVDSVNNIVQQFNNRLKPLVDMLNSNLRDAQFIFINTSGISLLDPSTIGIKVSNAPCCTVTYPWGLCEDGKKPCTNRNEYSFWDNFHPSEVMNHAVAARAFDAVLPSDVYPIDIHRLVQQ